MMPMHLVIDLARDLAIVAIRTLGADFTWLVLIEELGGRQVKFPSGNSFIYMGEQAGR
jgi:hypothetical protein